MHLELVQSDVRRRFNQAEDERGFRFNPRGFAISALPLGRNAAGCLPSCHPANDAGRADFEARSGLAAG
jgi:hypothetical protein